MQPPPTTDTDEDNMKRDPVQLGRWYVRPDGSARCPRRLRTEDGWSAVEYLQVMRNVARPRVQTSACSALSWWRWASRGAVVQPEGWWPAGIPRPE